MRKLTNILFCFLLIVFSYIPKGILSVNFFTDDFSTGNLEKWIDVSGIGTWTVDPILGLLKSSVVYHQSSYIIAKGTENLSDYEVNLDVLNISGIDQHILFRVDNQMSRYFQLELRYPDQNWLQDPAGTLRVWKYIDGSYTLVIPDIPINLNKNVKYHVKLLIYGSTIKIYLDNVLITEFNDNSILTGGFGLQGYAGDYAPGSVVNYFYNIIISGDSIKKQKTILIPGLGASWNTEAMVYGKTIADKDWKMTPFVKNYDNLIKGFKDNGLVEGQDFYVWNYDWRRPISEIVSSLNQFINQKIGSDEKVNLVGHSLGAVTARIWAQEHSGDFRIGKVVGLGGPQFGSIEAYDTWNGAKLGDSLDFHKIALNLVSVLNERESVKEFAPVLKDLVPIFDFIYKNPTVINNYLISKNIGFDNMISYIGSGEKTKRYIEEKKYLYGDGDGTVLINSASVGELNIAPSNHGDIVDKNINGILNNLDLGTTLSNYNFNNSLKNKLLFFIGSPAKFQVKCDGKIMGNNDELGFLIIDGKNLRGCTVKLTGTGNGKYHLVTAKIGDGESWHYYENYIKIGQIKNIQIDARDGHQENENECRDRKF